MSVLFDSDRIMAQVRRELAAKLFEAEDRAFLGIISQSSGQVMGHDVIASPLAQRGQAFLMGQQLVMHPGDVDALRARADANQWFSHADYEASQALTERSANCTLWEDGAAAEVLATAGRRAIQVAGGIKVGR